MTIDPVGSPLGDSVVGSVASGLFEKKEATGVWWRDHALSLILGVILIAQTVYALWSGAYVFTQEEPVGPGTPAWSSGFWVWWSGEYNVSVVADTYGVILIVLLSKWFREVGSAESKESESESG
jgi:hypothetical protein